LLHSRSYIFIPFFLFFLGYVLLENASPDVETSKIVGGLSAKYGNAKGWTAQYSREAISKTMAILGDVERHDVAEGKLYFKPPHLLRLEQISPQNESLITNGETVWWYLPLKKEVYKYPAAEFGRELSLLSDVLKGLKYSEDIYRITLKKNPETEDHHIILKRDPPWQDIDHLEMIISKGDFTIKQLDIYNSIGGLTRFLLGDWKEVAANKEFFTFSPLSDVKVIDK